MCVSEGCGHLDLSTASPIPAASCKAGSRVKPRELRHLGAKLHPLSFMVLCGSLIRTWLVNMVIPLGT